MAHPFLTRSLQTAAAQAVARTPALAELAKLTPAAAPAQQVREALDVFILASEAATNDRAQLADLQANCGQIAKLAAAVPPEVASRAAEQQKLLADFSRGPCRNRNWPEHLDSQEARAYVRVAGPALLRYFGACRVSAALFALKQRPDTQRASVNFAADACLVGAEGKVGGEIDLPMLRAAPETFVNLVETGNHGPLATLLTQGPKGGDQVSRLKQHTAAYAKQTECTHVHFVNLAAMHDQVPPYGALEGQPTSTYRQFDAWPDGPLLTPENRAHLVRFVVDLADEITAAGARGERTTVVANCHIGMDRSATFLALLRLAVDRPGHEGEPQHTEQAFADLRRARPRALSAVRRYEFLCTAAREMQALRAGSSASTAAAGGQDG